MLTSCAPFSGPHEGHGQRRHHHERCSLRSTLRDSVHNEGDQNKDTIGRLYLSPRCPPSSFSLVPQLPLTAGTRHP